MARLTLSSTSLIDESTLTRGPAKALNDDDNQQAAGEPRKMGKMKANPNVSVVPHFVPRTRSIKADAPEEASPTVTSALVNPKKPAVSGVPRPHGIKRAFISADPEDAVQLKRCPSASHLLVCALPPLLGEQRKTDSKGIAWLPLLLSKPPPVPVQDDPPTWTKKTKMLSARSSQPGHP
jgi:hypothetical protein